MENDARIAFGFFLNKYNIETIGWRNEKAWIVNSHHRYYGNNISDLIPFVVKPSENNSCVHRIGKVSHSSPKAYFKIFYDDNGVKWLDRVESMKLILEHFEWGDYEEHRNL